MCLSAELVVGKEYDMVVEDIPAYEVSKDIHVLSERYLLVSSLVGNRKERVVIPRLYPDVVVLIRRRLACLGNRQVAVHALVE